ncbi:sodium-coupled monocarboxylate transporter 1-like [Diadema antillarum]|uniref:sodium-coupled monocarboxylate transporter 1-like n=1 Tax=Diadema antillarum TaxID=105358 RepID=UPI003A8C63E6
MAENENKKLFGAWDYVVCSLVLSVAFIIGVATACYGRRRRVQRSPERFLLDNRKSSVVPVSISMTLTFTAAVNIIGTPVDVYMYNTMFWWITLAYVIGGILTCRLFVPLYFDLGVVSAYEYLEMRFNRSVRVFCSLLFTIQMMVFLGVVLYAPAMIVQTVTGFSLWASVGIIWLVAILYSTLGGIKAIVWSDVLQGVVIFVGIVVALVMGCQRVGGMGEVWRIAKQGDRLQVAIISFDPTVRHTVWSVVAGMTVIVVMTTGTNQTIVQRYLSLATPRRAKIAMAISTVLKIVLVNLCVMLGLVIYAFYSQCDPLSAGAITHPDQLAPFFVMDLFADHPGLPGLFVSVLLAASMSSLSSGINSLSAAAGEDFIKALRPNMGSSRYSMVLRLVGILYGFVILGFAFLAAALRQSILPLTVTVFGVIGGVTLGVFTLGIFFHRSNPKGTLIGALISLLVVVVLKLISTTAPSSFYDGSPMMTTGCLSKNATTTAYDELGAVFTEVPLTSAEPSSDRRYILAGLYRLSYQYYALIGLVLTVALGMVASGLSGFADPDTVHPSLKLYVVDSLLCCLPVCLKDLVRRDGLHVDAHVDKIEKEKEKAKNACEDAETSVPMIDKPRPATPVSDCNDYQDEEDKINEELENSPEVDAILELSAANSNEDSVRGHTMTTEL